MLDQAQQPSETAGRETRLWRSLAELEGDPQFMARVKEEFAPGAQWWIDQPSRRAFLKRMSAAFALAGLTGCVRQPKEEIVPYVQTPEGFVPGIPLYFATAMSQPGGAIGLLALSHEGRPTKVEGNALHPESLGSTDAYAQASVLNLYDPERSKVVRQGERLSNWVDFQAAFQPQLDQHRANSGRGFALVTEGILSPTLKSQIQALFEQLPELKWYQFEPSRSQSVERGAELAFGRKAVPYYKLDQAEVIFSLDADFFSCGPSRVRLAREFAKKRSSGSGKDLAMSRFYMAESTPTTSGAAADHRVRLTPGQLVGLFVALAGKLGVDVGSVTTPEADRPSEAAQHWLDVVVADLQANRGKSAILVGDNLPAPVQALGYALNAELGNVGTSVVYLEPLDAIPDHTPGTIEDLSKALDAKEVQSLFVLGGDIVYNAPAELQLAQKIRSLPFSVQYGLYVDATSNACQWHLPATHELEEWSDTVAANGTATIIQPLIAPLYDGRSPHDVLNLLLGRMDQSSREVVEAYWRGQFGSDADAKWKKSLQDGIVEETAASPIEVSVSGNIAGAFGDAWGTLTAGADEFTLVFRNDPSLLDGRYTSNVWLQEVPRPISKLTWGNAAWISTAAAEKLNLKNGSVIKIERGDVAVELPVWIQPGQPASVITLDVGHARKVGDFEIVGVDVGPLRTVQNWWYGTGKVTATGKKSPLATTQEHHEMMGRDLVRVGNLQQLKEDPEHPQFMHLGHHHGPPRDEKGNFPTLYPDWPQEGPQWGMTINLGACVGCNACVIACQSENNIPVVGADQIRRGREMHWLRIDSYFGGEKEDPEIYHQPVTCMHCEHAPCEPVCPVGATTHSDSGLNEMTYNRCIGTRYCSNNCPYKVRRFNFLDFRKDIKEEPVLQLLQNPEVTVRSRGVMEKCTYCVQRINSVRIKSKVEGREIEDGEVVTACQSACPTQAITFGNIADKSSQVAQQKASPLNYGLLDELNTRPRTSYLAAVKNPNPQLAPVEAAKEHA